MRGSVIVKNKSLIDNIMHFLLHNSFIFTVAVMFLVHAVLLGISWYAGVMPLVNFNIVSVIVYIFCIVLCKYGHILPVYVSIFSEVTIYAIVSISYIGWECGSYYFLFSIIPIILYFGCFIFKGQQRWIIVGLLAVNLAMFVFLFIGYSEAKPLYEVAYGPKTFYYVFSALAMVLSMIFYNVIYIYSSEVEVNTLEEKNEKLSLDAQEDALTSLLNRRGFLPQVGALMNSEHTNHFCIAFCDIDNFKRINDSYGHDCGDEVLRHISKLIKKEMQGCDICRWGGEEFVILLKDYDFAVAKKKMEYIRSCIETTPTIFYNKRITATVTIGLEEYKDGYNEPEEIIKVADGRMYYGKQHGKNILIYEDEEDTTQSETAI